MTADPGQYKTPSRAGKGNPSLALIRALTRLLLVEPIRRDRATTVGDPPASHRNGDEHVAGLWRSRTDDHHWDRPRGVNAQRRRASLKFGAVKADGMNEEDPADPIGDRPRAEDLTDETGSAPRGRGAKAWHSKPIRVDPRIALIAPFQPERSRWIASHRVLLMIGPASRDRRFRAGCQASYRTTQRPPHEWATSLAPTGGTAFPRL